MGSTATMRKAFTNLLKDKEALKPDPTLHEFLPYSSHVTPRIIKTDKGGGDYMRVWKIGGIPHETVDGEDIQIRMDALNQLIRSMGTTNISLWTHNVRRRISDRLDGEFDNDFCRHLHDKYQDSFNGYSMMATEIYLTMIYRPNPRLFDRIVKTKTTPAQREKEIREAIRKTDEYAATIESSLRRYDIEPLGTYDINGILFSEMKEFLGFLVNGFWERMPVDRSSIKHSLITSHTIFGTETVEIRNATQTRFAGCLDITAQAGVSPYPAHTDAGMLNGLMYLPFEYVLTQSFSPVSRSEAIGMLEKQRNQLISAEDVGQTQIKEIETALDQLVNGQFVIGEYHLNLTVYGDTGEQLTKNISDARSALQEVGFQTARVNRMRPAWLSQLPGNWRWRLRPVILTSRNFSGLSSFHNFYAGKRSGNPWGDAVMMFKTPSGQPFYFNFHKSREDEDARDEKALGNTSVIGQSGAGKTVLLGMLIAISRKYKARPRQVLLDKDRGGELLIRKAGGKYLALRSGVRTGFNPFQLEDTPETHQFLEKLVKRCVTIENPQPLTIRDENDLTLAINTVMMLDKHDRRISALLQSLQNTGDNCLRMRLQKWCGEGALAWVLDNPTDALDLTSHSLYGFDGTSFLDNPIIRTPISMYLLYRMEQMIDGQPFQYFMDEYWKWLEDDYFSEFSFNKQKTIRKQNGMGVFATQSPSDVLKSPVSRGIIEQCATEIYLPNPKADKSEYIDGFKVSAAEYAHISSLGEDSRMMVIKHGGKSAITMLNLSGWDEELSYLSGSTDNIKLLDEIMAEVGEDPKVWSPIFQQRIGDRKRLR